MIFPKSHAKIPYPASPAYSPRVQADEAQLRGVGEGLRLTFGDALRKISREQKIVRVRQAPFVIDLLQDQPQILIPANRDRAAFMITPGVSVVGQFWFSYGYPVRTVDPFFGTSQWGIVVDVNVFTVGYDEANGTVSTDDIYVTGGTPFFVPGQLLGFEAVIAPEAN